MDRLKTRVPLGTSGRVKRYEGNLFALVAPEGMDFDVHHVREDLEDIALLAQGDPVLLMLDGRGTASISIAARRLIGSKVLLDYGIVAFAAMVGSPLSRVLAGFQMRINPPAMPMRVFTDEKVALDWLTKFSLAEIEHVQTHHRAVGASAT